jgi:hypothetical protein
VGCEGTTRGASRAGGSRWKGNVIGCCSRRPTRFLESSSNPSGPTRCRPTLTAAQVRATLPAAVGTTRSWVASWRLGSTRELRRQRQSVGCSCLRCSNDCHPAAAFAAAMTATQLTRILWYLWVHLQQQEGYVLRGRAVRQTHRQTPAWHEQQGRWPQRLACASTMLTCRHSCRQAWRLTSTTCKSGRWCCCLWGSSGKVQWG